MLGAQAQLLRHEASGAELLYFRSDESNLTFAVGFATLPGDDTGVAHILEHMVLAGSERFPLKDPFFEMVKGSVAGFINAMTWPDRTVYPFATEHPQDFLNLLHVYLDAVFRPRLTRETFDQEAWHLEPGEQAGTLRWRGVVFNEMKGAAGNPDRALDRTEAQALLGDTAYRFDSGGIPAAIPDLTHDQLRAFHRDHYHPSRARFVLHGDLPLDDTLAAIAGYLDGAARLEPLPPATLPARFEVPRSAHGVYPADARGKAMATVAWATEEPASPVDTLLWQLLARVVVGTPASPLRRALLDAGLGEAFVGGFSDERRTPVFQAGLRGVETERAPEVHALVLDTLRRLVERGLADDDVIAARNRLEFASRELAGYGGQRGLVAALAAMGVWFHGRDPIAELDLDRAFADLDDRLAGGAGAALTAWLRRGLLDEPHRVDVTIAPDLDLSRRRQAEEDARLAEAAAGLDEAGLAAVATAAADLDAHQRRPDDEAAQAALPRLSRADLAAAREQPTPSVEPRGGAELVWVDRPTRGLVYLDLAFDLGALPERLLPLVAVLGRSLLETGTERSDLADLSRRIDRDTGGIAFTVETQPGVDGRAGVARFVLQGKALASQVDALAGILLEVLTEARLDDRDAVRRLALEDLARRRTALEPSGHAFVSRRLAAHGSLEGRIAELTGGLASLDVLGAIVRRADESWDALRADLLELRSRLLTRAALVAGITADAAAAAAARAAVEGLVDALPHGAADPVGATLPAPDMREGWVLPGQVHYVGIRWPLRDGARLPGGWLAAARHLSTDVLLPAIRFRGGAYSAGASLDPFVGALTEWSYRDPNLAATLDVYRAAPAQLREAAEAIDDRGLDTLIVGAVGKLDPYAPPGTSGYRALLRYLRGTEGEIDRLRADLLATTRQDFRDLADAIEAAGDPPVVVLGPRPGLEAASAAGPATWTVREPA